MQDFLSSDISKFLEEKLSLGNSEKTNEITILEKVLE